MDSVDKKKLFYGKTRSEWRKWLVKNFTKENEVWLVFPKQISGKKRISYNDAVEEALCFGWIDSTQKTLDAAHTIQRFTPRKLKSKYSQPNKERLRWLLMKNKIHNTLIATVTAVLKEEFIFPADILRTLAKDKAVWDNYQRFSEPYKRIRIAYIDGARDRPEEFQKRLKNFVQKTRQNKIIPGHGGIDKYY